MRWGGSGSQRALCPLPPLGGLCRGSMQRTPGEQERGRHCGGWPALQHTRPRPLLPPPSPEVGQLDQRAGAGVHQQCVLQLQVTVGHAHAVAAGAAEGSEEEVGRESPWTQAARRGAARHGGASAVPTLRMFLAQQGGTARAHAAVVPMRRRRRKAATACSTQGSLAGGRAFAAGGLEQRTSSPPAHERGRKSSAGWKGAGGPAPRGYTCQVGRPARPVRMQDCPAAAICAHKQGAQLPSRFAFQARGPGRKQAGRKQADGQGACGRAGRGPAAPHRKHDLDEEPACLGLRQAMPLGDVAEQVPAPSILHHQHLRWARWRLSSTLFLCCAAGGSAQAARTRAGRRGSRAVQAGTRRTAQRSAACVPCPAHQVRLGQEHLLQVDDVRVPQPPLVHYLQLALQQA